MSDVATEPKTYPLRDVNSACGSGCLGPCFPSSFRTEPSVCASPLLLKATQQLSHSFFNNGKGLSGSNAM